jgi:protein-disulfide isomerase
MNKKQRGILLVIIVCVVFIASIFFIQRASEKKGDTFPDLDSVKVDKVPEDFDYANQPVIGSRDAPVKIVEFMDYKCPTCKKWTETVLPKLDQDYIQSGKAAVYVLDYPFLAPDSNLAALAGETLYQQNHEFFETYYKLMMEKQKNEKLNWVTKDFLLSLVKEGIPGADLQQFEKDLDAGTYLQQVKKDKEIGKRLAIPGTPTIYVNGLHAENADYETVKALVEQELAK